MTDARAKMVEETRIQELAKRHMDLVSRMDIVDTAIARRAVGAAVRADPTVPFAFALGEQAVRLRAESERAPSAAGPSTGDLRGAIAFILDQMAARYPHPERFASRFRFRCAAEEADAAPEYGRGYLDLFAWNFERVFAGPSGRVMAPYKVPAVDRLAGMLRLPLPADFFRLTFTGETMAAAAIMLYCRLEGESPKYLVTEALRAVPPDAVVRLLDDAAAAVGWVDNAIVEAVKAEPAPAPEPRFLF